MRTAIVTFSVALLACVCLCGCTSEQQYAVTALASPDQDHIRLGVTTEGGEVECGLFGALTQDLVGDDQEYLVGGGYATLNLMSDGQLLGSPAQVEGVALPVDVYVGAYGGAVEEDQGILAALIAGVRFAPLVVEYQHQLGADEWNELSPVTDGHTCFIGVRCKLP